MEDFAILRATNGLQFIAAKEEDAWLDGPDLQTIVQQLRACPCLAEVGGALEVNGPSAGLGVGLVARGAENVAIGELHGLVLDGAEDAFRQLLSGGPGFAAIGRGFELTPPGARRWADFVEEHQRAFFRLEEHGIPSGMPRTVGLHAIGRFDAFGPLAIGKLTRHPDAHIGIAFRCAAEPGRDEPRGRFDDGRGMDLRVRTGVVDVFGGEDGGIGGDRLPGAEFVAAIELAPDDGVGLATIGSGQLELVVDPRDDLLLGGVDALQRECGIVGFDGELRCLQHFAIGGYRMAESACERRLLAMRGRNDGE